MPSATNCFASHAIRSSRGATPKILLPCKSCPFAQIQRGGAEAKEAAVAASVDNHVSRHLERHFRVRAGCQDEGALGSCQAFILFCGEQEDNLVEAIKLSAGAGISARDRFDELIALNKSLSPSAQRRTLEEAIESNEDVLQEIRGVHKEDQAHPAKSFAAAAPHEGDGAAKSICGV